MKLRKFIAILLGKMAITCSRLAGNQGTSFPGRLARKIYPGILSELAQNITRETIIITGTNGKTTTSNMIAEIMRENKSTYVHNQAGANMLTGITTAFIKASNLSGSRKFDYGLLETDEANVPLLLHEVKINTILITNFFSDQLDRYGELDYTINIIKEAVRNSRIELILNADDPQVSHFQKQTGLKCLYYGFAASQYDQLLGAESREGRCCVFCGHELVYERYHYGQLGKYHCPQCLNHNPDADYTAADLQMNPSIVFRINELMIKSPYQGFYNAYNILAAISMAKHLQIEDQIIQTAISRYQPRAGRMEKFLINGKNVILILVKNPAGLNQTMAMLGQDPAAKNIFIALNDNAADGRDISWIWDADAELLAREEANILQLTASGLRSGDMAVRVKYAGFDPAKIRIESRLKEGIELTVNASGTISYILCSYTALFECRKILLQKQKQSKPVIEEEKQKLTDANN